MNFASNTLIQIQQNKQLIKDSFNYCGISQNFRIKNLNGKLKRYFQLDDDWDKEAYLENLILQKSVKSVEIIGTKKIEDLECADINDENQEGDESDEDDNYEICIDNILEIEKLMVGNQEETDEDFESNFTRL